NTPSYETNKNIFSRLIRRYKHHTKIAEIVRESLKTTYTGEPSTHELVRIFEDCFLFDARLGCLRGL
ncbi:MAG: hypothetical protein QXE63_04475, partial [Zestosphaera sp.]